MFFCSKNNKSQLPTVKIISLIIFTFSICLSYNTVRRDYERLMGS